MNSEPHMTLNPSSQTSIRKPVLLLMFAAALNLTMTEAKATPGIMQANDAPMCTSCHTGGAYSSSEGRAGLAAYLASKTSSCTPPQVLQNNVCVTPSNSDPLFSYLESAYPAYFSPGGSSTATKAGYTYRYYPKTKTYLGTANDTVYYLGPASKNKLISIGSVTDWHAKAAATGSKYPGGNHHSENDDDDGYEHHGSKHDDD